MKLKQGSDGVWGTYLKVLTRGCNKSHEIFQWGTEKFSDYNNLTQMTPMKYSWESLMKVCGMNCGRFFLPFLLRQSVNRDLLGHQRE